MYKSNYMKNMPDFKEGLSRILDLGSTINKNKFKIIQDDNKADYEALRLDWKIVGDDIRGAIDEFETVEHCRRERL